MLNITSMNTVADNSIVINGIEVARFNDSDTEKLLSVINGLKSGVTTTPVAKTEKKRYEYKQDIDPKWSVEKIDGLYCIKSGIYSKQRIAKTVANSYIKKLDGIKTVKVAYQDGSDKTYNAWGYSTKKKAEEMMSALPSKISASECNELSEKRG